MSKTNTLQDFIVWKKGHHFFLEIYKFTKQVSKDEIYRLNSQIRRAIVSITVNSTEGYKRTNNKDKLPFYKISQISLEESSCFLILYKDLNYIQKQ